MIVFEGKRYHLGNHSQLKKAAEILPSDSAITFIDANGFVTFYREVKRLPFTIQLGMSVFDKGFAGSVTAQTWHDKTWKVRAGNQELMGFPYTIIAFPVFDDQSSFSGVLSIAFPAEYSQEIDRLQKDNEILQWLFRLSDVLLFLDSPSELWPQFRDLFMQLMHVIGGCYLFFYESKLQSSVCFGRVPIHDDDLVRIKNDAKNYFLQHHLQEVPLTVEFEGQTYQLERYNLSFENHSGEIVYLIQYESSANQKLMRFLLDYYRMAIQLINQRKTLRDQLDFDSLTGIWNRRALETHMEEYFISQNGKPAVFVLFDLDQFKTLNDTKGHQAGDQALKSVAMYIRKTLRKGDFAARLGGDEFVMVLQNTTWNEWWVHQMRIMIAKSPLSVYHLGVTAGIVEIPSEASTYQDAYRLADQRLYHGKKKGKNRVVFQPDQHEWVFN